MSLGRGTSFPFEAYGHGLQGSTSFTPVACPCQDALLNQKCFGVDLRNIPHEKIWEGFDLSTSSMPTIT